MKRFVSLFVVLSLCLCMLPAHADFWDDVKSGLNSAVDSVQSAWNSVSETAGEAWNSVSEAAGKAWNSVSETAGDVWNSVQDAADQAVAWTKDNAKSAWKWAVDTATGAWDWTKATASETGTWWIKELVSTSGDTLDSLKTIYDETCTKLGIAAEQATDMWNGLTEYAKENDISADKLVKLALAALISVTGEELGNADAAQDASDYLNKALGTDDVWASVEEWLNETGIDDEADADESLDQLETAVKAD